MSLNVDGVLENERYATTSRRARPMHRRVARWTGSSDDRVTGPNGQPQLAEHVEPKAVNVLHYASAFGGATRCIAFLPAVVGQNVANLHFCPGPKKKCELLSQKNDLLSRLVINGGVFCPGTEPRKKGTERVGQNVAYFLCD